MAKTNTTGKSKTSSPITDNTRIIGIEAGRIPPQAIDLEEAVLGALMLEGEAIFEVLELLKPECFYKEAHAIIYNAILSLSGRNEPIDLLTVTDRLRKSEQLEEVGGSFYLVQLTNRVMSSANIRFHAQIIAQKYIQRELIRAATSIQERAFDERMDVEDLLNSAEQSMFEITQGNIKRDAQSVEKIAAEVLAEMHEAQNHDDLTGVPSGFTNLDRITAGWQKTDLVIIAARPAMGKTAFVLSMARNMAVEHKRTVAVFSLEMSAMQLVKRLISAEAEIASEKIKTGKLSAEEWGQLDTKIRNLVEAPLFIDDTPALSVFEFRAKCRRLFKQHNLGIAIVDYLQLMTWTGDSRGNREQEVSNISRSLKAIAKELNIPIIALSQLNRSVETRNAGATHKRPQLSDLRESGAIEQDADMVLFIHRPEYYGFTEDENGQSLAGVAEIIIAKYRNGGLGTIHLKFKSEFTKFVEFDEILTLPSKMNNDNERETDPAQPF